MKMIFLSASSSVALYLLRLIYLTEFSIWKTIKQEQSKLEKRPIFGRLSASEKNCVKSIQRHQCFLSSFTLTRAQTVDLIRLKLIVCEANWPVEWTKRWKKDKLADKAYIKHSIFNVWCQIYRLYFDWIKQQQLFNETITEANKSYNRITKQIQMLDLPDRRNKRNILSIECVDWADRKTIDCERWNRSARNNLLLIKDRISDIYSTNIWMKIIVRM